MQADACMITAEHMLGKAPRSVEVLARAPAGHAPAAKELLERAAAAHITHQFTQPFILQMLERLFSVCSTPESAVRMGIASGIHTILTIFPVDDQ